ncbi:hypothetical protein CA13_64850 [Planctomycetes bacterium CA13]|uniref:Uncharacterized protein n=1 Tax=Novipirellula herctigrandis TaxID=2527986 RepID=A0A5C5ZEN3_9BACT|nr:hypothetical protein CA13_64850 [Planctomycetes bacterium CA13]
MIKHFRILTIALFVLPAIRLLTAQDLPNGSEGIDQRRVFLMVSLLDVEANLNAVDEANAKSKGRACAATIQAIRIQPHNHRMNQRPQSSTMCAERMKPQSSERDGHRFRTQLSYQRPIDSANVWEPTYPYAGAPKPTNKKMQ